MALQWGATLYAVSTVISTRLPSRPSHRGSLIKTRTRSLDVPTSTQSIPLPEGRHHPHDRLKRNCRRCDVGVVNLSCISSAVPTRDVITYCTYATAWRFFHTFSRIYKEILPHFFFFPFITIYLCFYVILIAFGHLPARVGRLLSPKSF